MVSTRSRGDLVLIVWLDSLLWSDADQETQKIVGEGLRIVHKEVEGTALSLYAEDIAFCATFSEHRQRKPFEQRSLISTRVTQQPRRHCYTHQKAAHDQWCESISIKLNCRVCAATFFEAVSGT